MTIFRDGVGQTFRPPTKYEFDFQLQPIVGYINNDGSVVNSVVADAQIRTITAAYSDPYYDIGIQGTSDDVAISLLDATGSLSGSRVSRVSNGTCRVLARHPFLGRLATLDMNRINDNVYDELHGYVTGSLAAHISDQTSALISGKTAADMPIFSVQDHTTPIYTRNLTCWAAPLNLTAISPWNSLGGAYRAGVAITPRHTLHAKHFGMTNGTVLRFIAADNSVISRTVSNVYNIPEAVTYGRDVQIALLDSDLPASITPVKFLPANAFDYLPSWHNWKIPLLFTNQFERMACGVANIGSYASIDWVAMWVTTEAPYATMYERVITLDSGSPAFVVINGALTLVCHWTFAGQGACHHLMLTEIATALTTLGGGHSLSTVDLSGFTSYA